jgi:hypothetical protein
MPMLMMSCSSFSGSNTKGVTCGGWRLGLSAREGESVRNEVRGVCRASWLRNTATCVSVHEPVHSERGEGGTDRTGPRCRERGQGHAGNGSTTSNPGPQDRERRRACGRRKTGADRSAPAGSE